MEAFERSDFASGISGKPGIREITPNYETEEHSNTNWLYPLTNGIGSSAYFAGSVLMLDSLESAAVCIGFSGLTWPRGPMTCVTAGYWFVVVAVRHGGLNG